MPPAHAQAMIHGIGTDIVQVARVARLLDRYGERFARRILTVQEYRDFQQVARPAQFLARRFAAKEAAVNAFGTGFRGGLSPRHIGVAHDSAGRPLLTYQGPADALRKQLNVGAGFLSIADEREYAIAFVTLLREPGTQ